MDRSSRSAPSEIPTPAELLGRARALIPALADRAPQAARDRKVPKETVAEMQAAGLFRVMQPKRWGGYEMVPSAFFDIQLALAEGDMATGWIYGLLGVHPWLMALMDDRAAEEVWGADQSVLISSSLMPGGKAIREGDGFRLSGRWRFSSGCEHARWAFLGGLVETGEEGARDQRLFLVPRESYEIVDVWRVSGLQATGSHDIAVASAFVPDYRTRKMVDNFNAVGPGQALNKSPLYRIPFGQIFFHGVTTPPVGALQGMLAAFLDYGAARVTRRGRTSDDPVAQLACAETVAALDEMTTILHRNVGELLSYAEQGVVPPIGRRQHYRFQASLNPERCSQLAARLFKCVGGSGLYDDLPFGRMLADINAGRLHNAAQYELMGRNLGALLLGVEGKPDFMV